MSRGVIAIPMTMRGEILVLPHVDEPVKKTETVVGTGLPMEDVVGYELPAGAIESGEEEDWGTIREILEESGMLVTFSQLIPGHFGIRVRQMRGGVPVEYGVNIVYLLLTDLQEKYWRLVKEARPLTEIDPKELRPRDRAIKQMLEARE